MIPNCMCHAWKMHSYRSEKSAHNVSNLLFHYADTLKQQRRKRVERKFPQVPVAHDPQPLYQSAFLMRLQELYIFDNSTS
jgi:hypothetical protein